MAAGLSAGTISTSYGQDPKCKKECCKKCDDKCAKKCSKDECTQKCDDKKACSKEPVKA